jgi:hypothetical protein
VAARNDTKELDRQLVTWNPTDQQWKDKDGRVRDTLAFSLTSETVTDPDLTSVRFVAKYSVTGQGQVLVVNHDLGGFTKQEKVVTPLSVIDSVTVDPGDLTWRAIDNSSPLQRVDVKLESGSRSKSFTIRPIVANGQAQIPLPVYWFVRHDEAQPDPVRASAAFLESGGKTVQWKGNGTDLRTLTAGLHWNLDDSFWNLH